MTGGKTTVPDMRVCLQRTGKMTDFCIPQFCIYTSHSEVEKLKKIIRLFFFLYITITKW